MNDKKVGFILAYLFIEIYISVKIKSSLDKRLLLNTAFYDMRLPRRRKAAVNARCRSVCVNVICEGDPLEIYTESNGTVIFKKYSPIGELGEFASQYAESLSKTTGIPACITDKDNVIAVSGAPKKELREKKVSGDLERVMASKSVFLADSGDKTIQILDGSDQYGAGVVAPIVFEGDSIGSVIFLANAGGRVGEVESKLAEAAAGFLGRTME